MPRSLWTGSLSFGLVNVPVALHTGVRDIDVHFHQLHGKDGAPIETRRFCSQEEREVAYEEIAHGYELEDGRQVIVTDEELAAVAPRKTRTIDIEGFVDLADVDPIYFDHPYFLAPAGEGEGVRRAYALMVQVLGSTDRAALGRFVLRTKEYLVLIRVREGLLALTTMRFHDEIRSTEGIESGAGTAPAEEQVENTVSLIEALSEEWDPGRYEDRYRQRLLELIERKKQTERVRAPRREREPAPAAPDLMAALRRSMEAVGESGDRAPREEAAGPPDEDRRAEDELDRLSREELYERAQEADIPGRSKMNKQQLVSALSR